MMNRTTCGLVSLLALGAAACGSGAGLSGEGGETMNGRQYAADLPAAGADTDGDGVPDTNDFCPGTAPGAAVDGNGCSSDQNADLSLTTITLDPQGSPLTFHARKSDVTSVAGGLAVSGSLLLDTPIGQITLLGADVAFRYAANSTDVATWDGTVQVPLPRMKQFAAFGIAQPATAHVGYDFGSAIKGDGDPLALDTKYLYFDTAAGFSLAFGNASIKGPGGGQRIFLDPSDPFFYIHGEVSGVPKLGEAALGVGISAHGAIPFAPSPAPVWGLDPADIPAMAGNIEFTGHVPLLDLPIALQGTVVYGATFGSNAAPTAVQMAANEEVDLSVDFIDGLATFEMPIAQATFGGAFTSDKATAFFSGQLSPGQSLPVAPIAVTQTANVAGFVGSDLSESWLTVQEGLHGGMNMVGASLAKTVGVQLQDLALVQATAKFDHTGVNLTGVASTSMRADVSIGGAAQITAFFGADPSAWSASMKGNFGFGGINLLNAHVQLNRNGLAAGGTLGNGSAPVDLEGTITDAGGVQLSGDVAVSIPMMAPVLCETFVTDAALCGEEWLVQDTRCAATVVKDAAICGYDTVGDCFTSGFTDCKRAATCKINGSCWVTGSCNVPTTCTGPTTKNVGTYSGTLHVSLGDNGLSAALTGQLCSGPGPCAQFSQLSVSIQQDSGGIVKACMGKTEYCINL